MENSSFPFTTVFLTPKGFCPFGLCIQYCIQRFVPLKITSKKLFTSFTGQVLCTAHFQTTLCMMRCRRTGCYMHDSFCRCLWRFSRATASLLLRWCETFKIRHLLISKHGNAANCPAKQRFNMKKVLKIQKSVNRQGFQINIIASNRESNFWVELARGKNCNATKCRSYSKTGVLFIL